MKRFTLVFAGAIALVSGIVRADTPPSVWERAKDVDAAEAYDLHRAAQQRLIRTDLTEVDFGERGRVLAMLERAGAERSRHAFLRFDLAEVYLLLKNYPRAAQIYKAAIAEFPNHPAVDEGWSRLADACGHTGDHACERTAWIEVLRRETEDIHRVTPTMNLAETLMHLGDLKEAIDGYREALRLGARVPSGEKVPLATWGLAVALDRSGDRLEAEKQARFAVQLERSLGINDLLRSKYVFFVPEYEVYWYYGLGAAARAAEATSPREAVAFWRQAEAAFTEYVKGGERKNDRWLPIAKARLARIRAERERAEKAATRLPPQPRSGEDVPL